MLLEELLAAGSVNSLSGPSTLTRPKGNSGERGDCFSESNFPGVIVIPGSSLLHSLFARFFFFFGWLS